MLGEHDARLGYVESEMVAMREEIIGRLDSQDQALADLKELVAMAKGGLAVLGKIGAWALGIGTLIHAMPTLISLFREKP